MQSIKQTTDCIVSLFRFSWLLFLLFIQHYSCPFESATDFQPDFVVKHKCLHALISGICVALLHVWTRWMETLDALDGDVRCVGWIRWIYTLDVLDGDVG